MIAVYLFPVFLAAQSIIAFWLLRYLSACSRIFLYKGVQVLVVLFYLFPLFAMYLGLLLPHGKAEHIVKLIGNNWYGISIYIFLIVYPVLLFRLILKISKWSGKEIFFQPNSILICGTVCILLVIGICIAGWINAGIIRTTEYEVTIDKDGGNFDELNVVLIADFHLGHTIGPKMMKQMVEKVNACNPDVIMIAGDIFDNEYDAVKNPDEIAEILRGMKSKYGVYAVYGNHDCEEPIVGGFTFPSKNKKMSDMRMDELIAASNIKLLWDESVLIEDSIYLYGRPDEERPGRYIEERATPEELMQKVDASKPVIVFEHEPKELDEIADAGVDLHLAGHTHDGQLFPLTISCALIWENSCGMIQKSQMTSIVTSGVGLYGPNLRVGTIPEICNIHITFD